MKPFTPVLVLLCACFWTCHGQSQGDGAGWYGWGGGYHNNRRAGNSSITSANALNLQQRCKIPYKGGVSATPVVLDNIAYYPTWNGLYVAVDITSCKPVWQFNVSAYNYDFGITKEQANYTYDGASRTSAAIDGDILYFGTQTNALLVALNKTSGQPLGRLQINPFPYAVITTSPTVYNGTVYVGCSSTEESVASYLSNYKCCSFVGNMLAVTFDATKGQFNTLWNQSMLPSEPAGWAGVAVWGSQPSVDVSRSQIFIATGNVYTVPSEFTDCQTQAQNISVVASGLVPSPCSPMNVYQESVLAFDLMTGFINWSRQLSALDSWIIACGTNQSVQNPLEAQDTALCPHKPGVDADFGMMPSFVPASANTPHNQDTLLLGQKNGNLYALSAQSGTVFWATSTSPDGNIGGLIWGIAADDQRVYFTAVNSDLKTWSVQPSGTKISTSAFGALSLTNGSILWETPVPQSALSVAPPTVVNDVVLFSRVGNATVKAYDKTPGGVVVVEGATGKVLHDYDLDTDMHGGYAVVGSQVIFGTGYDPATENHGELLVWSL